MWLRRHFLEHASQLIDEFNQQFPDRVDRFTLTDIQGFAPFSDLWSRVFEHYDVIIAYSTDGFLPLLAGRRYLAFEHGTLREIPFRHTPEGRRTALAYRLAEHVFVTNFDCLGNAATLAPGRHTLINHPFDEDHSLLAGGVDSERHALCAELNCEFLFFFPTRHDWVAGSGYADKGNDVFLRGMAALTRAGFRIGAVCCEWGANVAQSKALLAELGIAEQVKWIAPVPTVRFERLSRAAHCVVDQFMLGSFGGVLFKAMAAGAPVLTYLEETQLLRQYPVCPPVLNCRTAEEVFEVVSPLIAHPDQLAAIGLAGRKWMQKHHSKHSTVLSQMPAFSRCLSDRSRWPRL
jgi:glycosyltransferase involved in cell wall biosynthesis